MQRPTWGRRLILASLWALAMSTWGSIGHHLFGLPDAGPILVLIAVGAILMWPHSSRMKEPRALHERANAS